MEIMETLIKFDKEEKVKEISLDVLKKTTSLAQYNGKLPSNRPLEHFDFIELVGEKLDKFGYKFEMEPIYISKSEIKRVMVLDPNDQGLPKSFLIQRMVTKMNLVSGDFDKPDINGAIALGYTEKGIQAAFGVNVKVCSNMSILGRELMSTWGSNKMPFDKLIELVDKYIQDLPKITERNFNILERMKEFPVRNEDIVNTIGEMHVRAVMGAYHNNDFALNIGQVSAFTSGMINNHGNIVEDEKELITLWDFYNSGTEILHPKRSDITTVWPDNQGWSHFILDKFGLN